MVLARGPQWRRRSDIQRGDESVKSKSGGCLNNGNASAVHSPQHDNRYPENLRPSSMRTGGRYRPSPWSFGPYAHLWPKCRIGRPTSRAGSLRHLRSPVYGQSHSRLRQVRYILPVTVLVPVYTSALSTAFKKEDLLQSFFMLITTQSLLLASAISLSEKLPTLEWGP
jgi:hypothetical protein